jgi:hypothetical protein
MVSARLSLPPHLLSGPRNDRHRRRTQAKRISDSSRERRRGARLRTRRPLGNFPQPACRRRGLQHARYFQRTSDGIEMLKPSSVNRGVQQPFRAGSLFPRVTSCRYEPPPPLTAAKPKPGRRLGQTSSFAENLTWRSNSCRRQPPLQWPESETAFASATEAPLASVKVMRAGMRKFEPGADTRATAMR